MIDACLNMDTQVQSINIGDNDTPPVAAVTGAAIDLVMDASCEITLDASVVEDGSTDNCGLDDLFDPSVFDVGTTAEISLDGMNYFTTLTIAAA